MLPGSSSFLIYCIYFKYIFFHSISGKIQKIFNQTTNSCTSVHWFPEKFKNFKYLVYPVHSKLPVGAGRQRNKKKKITGDDNTLGTGSPYLIITPVCAMQTFYTVLPTSRPVCHHSSMVLII